MHKLKSISRCQHSCTLHLIWHLPLNFELLAQTASSRNLIAMQKKNNPVPYKSNILHFFAWLRQFSMFFLRIYYYNIDNLRIVKKKGFWNYEIQVKSYEGILKICLCTNKLIFKNILSCNFPFPSVKKKLFLQHQTWPWLMLTSSQILTLYFWIYHG